jgi:hypothetical protein
MEEIVQTKKLKALSAFITPTNSISNPWSEEDVDRMEFKPFGGDDYKKVVDACRFFYKKDPIASTTINKLIEIGINELTFTKGTLSANEYKIFESLKEPLQDFAESMALEYLVSGLVIPEVQFQTVNKEYLSELGIKKYDYLEIPVTMWLRDPATVTINSSQLMGDKPSYYIKIPDKMIYFINHNGTYPDQTKDVALFQQMQILYPDFVQRVKNGERKVLLDNDLIFRRRYLTDSPYPVPYLYSAIEPMKHKRNLRRMDYSVASRVISAIQLIKLGNDEYPVTEDDQEQFQAIKDQMFWRENKGVEVERIFQLFANHTLQIEWIMPDVTVLLDDAKYKNVNSDILLALGFPRTLLIGEAEKTNAGSTEYVTLSPVKTMENIRRRVLNVISRIVIDVAKRNNLKYTPIAKFKPLRLEDFSAFSTAIVNLYTSGNLSRSSYAEIFGFNWDDEASRRAEENEVINKLGVESFAPMPFSPQAGNGGDNLTNTTRENQNKSDKEK